MKILNYFKSLAIIVLLMVCHISTKAQSGTLTFYANVTDDGINIGTVLHDGQYSNDISGIQFDIFNANTDAEAAARTYTGSFVYAPKKWLNLEHNYLLMIDATTDNQVLVHPPRYLVIMSHDGSEFSFQGMRIGDYDGGQRKTKVEGYRNGIFIGAVTVQMPIGEIWEQNFDKTSFSSDIFGNVDEIRISRNMDDTYIGNEAGFNDFVFGAPVLPPSLTVSATSLNIAAATNSTATFDITSNTSWTITSNQTWLSANPVGGANNGTVTLTATEANTTSTTRTATLTIASMGVENKTVTVTQAAGSPTEVNNEKYRIIVFYPNPTTNGFTIETEDTPAALTIHTLTGSLVKTQTVSGKTYVDVSALKAGAYLVKVNGKTAKLVKL